MEHLLEYCRIILYGFKDFATYAFDFFFTPRTFGVIAPITIMPFELLTVVFFAVVAIRIVLPE